MQAERTGKANDREHVVRIDVFASRRMWGTAVVDKSSKIEVYRLRPQVY